MKQKCSVRDLLSLPQPMPDEFLSEKKKTTAPLRNGGFCFLMPGGSSPEVQHLVLLSVPLHVTHRTKENKLLVFTLQLLSGRRRGFFVTLNKEECCTVFYMTRPALFATVYSYIYLHLKCVILLDTQPVMMGT